MSNSELSHIYYSAHPKREAQAHLSSRSAHVCPKTPRNNPILIPRSIKNRRWRRAPSLARLLLTPDDRCRLRHRLAIHSPPMPPFASVAGSWRRSRDGAPEALHSARSGRRRSVSWPAAGELGAAPHFATLDRGFGPGRNWQGQPISWFGLGKLRIWHA